MTTGQKIYECRKAAGMTQEELADRLGVTRQAVSKWEQDIAFPETDKVLEMCKLFSVSADELLFGRENVHKVTNEKTESESEEKKNKYNPFSITSFILELVAILFWVMLLFIMPLTDDASSVIVGWSSRFTLLGTIVGPTFAIVGLCTGKKYGRRGKGFAITAIIIFVLILTMIVIALVFVGSFLRFFLILIYMIYGGGA